MTMNCSFSDFINKFYWEIIFEIIFLVFNPHCSTTVESTLVGSKKKQKGTLMFKWLKMCFKMVLSLLEHVSSINEHIRHWIPTFLSEKYDFWKKKFGAAVFPYVSLCIAFKQFLTKNGFWGWSKLFFENLPKIDSKSNSVLANP